MLWLSVFNIVNRGSWSFFTVEVGDFSSWKLEIFYRGSWRFFAVAVGAFLPWQLEHFHRGSWRFFTVKVGDFLPWQLEHSLIFQLAKPQANHQKCIVKIRINVITFRIGRYFRYKLFGCCCCWAYRFDFQRSDLGWLYLSTRSSNVTSCWIIPL